VTHLSRAIAQRVIQKGKVWLLGWDCKRGSILLFEYETRCFLSIGSRVSGAFDIFSGFRINYYVASIGSCR
jgi:hypothetical protein